MLKNHLMYLSVGQEITAKIVDLNEAEKKISLSMKALESRKRHLKVKRQLTAKNRLDIYEKDSKDRDAKVLYLSVLFA